MGNKDRVHKTSVMSSQWWSAVIAVVCSVLLHVLIFLGAANINILQAHKKIPRIKRSFDIKTIKEEKPVKRHVQKQFEQRQEEIRFQSPMDTRQVYIEQEMNELIVAKKDMNLKIDNMKQISQVSNSVEPDYITEYERADDLYKKVNRRDTEIDIFVPVAEIPDKRATSTPDQFLTKEQLPTDFINKMPGFTPQMVNNSFDMNKVQEKDVMQIAAMVQGRGDPLAVIKTEKELMPIQKYLLYHISVYTDPHDGQKYYKISLRAGKDALKLETLPKEIVFLLDCSLSINRRRLKELKEGLRYCLTHLNANDFFNIMAFKERTTKFRAHSINPDAQNIEDALRFVDGLSAGQKTDTYEALYASINPDTAVLPSYIIFFSDGRPTKGVKNPRRIINEISRLNNGKISIFSFSGGLGVNRYLLDFISYKNRGWTEYSYRTNFISEKMERLYKKISDPLLLNLRYHISGLEKHEIFPRMLPDFFRNTEFTLYGKYTDEDEFFLQFLGDVGDQTNEFIVNGALSEATLGNQDIARNWAFNKIYYLIGLLDYEGENSNIVKEIHFLSEKFNIKTPYSKNIYK